MKTDPDYSMTPTDHLLKAVFLPLIPYRVKPNHVTLLRFTLTPFVLYLFYTGLWHIAAGLFILAVFTDALDGALARTRGLITDWGRIYDPVADKLLIAVVAMIVVPFYYGFNLVFLIILTEVILIVGAYWMSYFYPDHELQANVWGKIKMFIQSVRILS